MQVVLGYACMASAAANTGMEQEAASAAKKAFKVAARSRDASLALMSQALQLEAKQLVSKSQGRP